MRLACFRVSTATPTRLPRWGPRIRRAAEHRREQSAGNLKQPPRFGPLDLLVSCLHSGLPRFRDPFRGSSSETFESRRSRRARRCLATSVICRSQKHEMYRREERGKYAFTARKPWISISCSKSPTRQGGVKHSPRKTPRLSGRSHRKSLAPCNCVVCRRAFDILPASASRARRFGRSCDRRFCWPVSACWAGDMVSQRFTRTWSASSPSASCARIFTTAIRRGVLLFAVHARRLSGPRSERDTLFRLCRAGESRQPGDCSKAVEIFDAAAAADVGVGAPPGAVAAQCSSA